MTLAVYSIAHFLTDAVCASAIFSSKDMIPFILMYDLLAFSTQAMFGILADTIKRYRYIAVFGGIMTVMGALLPFPAEIRVGLIGLGNSIFHVGGGAAVLKGSSNRAAPLGIFVAPGSLGLLVGILFPSIMIYVSVILAALCISLLFMKDYQSYKPLLDSNRFSKSKLFSLIIIIIILVSVSIRALASYSISFEWKTTVLLSLVLGFAVMAGKTAGGFILDKIKAGWLIVFSVVLAGPLIAFFTHNVTLSIIGQFLINCSMPLTLIMLYRMLPDYPGFSFGLAASFLFPGMIIGLRISLSNPIILLIFTINAALLLGAVKIMKKGSIKI